MGTSNKMGNGDANTFLGAEAGRFTTTGAYNTFIGYYPGYNNTTGSSNSFVGFKAGYTNTTGNSNLFIGSSAGYYNTAADFNSFVGNEAGYSNTIGNNNTFLGYKTGYANTTGSSNAFLGWRAGRLNTTGSSNVFVGSEAGVSNTTSGQNTFVGYQAGTVSTAVGNTFLGYQTGVVNTSGQLNVFIGMGAGKTNTTGTQNTFIGSGAGSTTDNPSLQNATALGYGAQVSANNSLILGSGANIGIGTSAPANKLEITKGLTNQSGLRLTNLTSSSPASVLNQTKFLTVNASGDVVLGSLNSSARIEARSELWIASGNQVRTVNGGSVLIGQGIGQTPAGYKLVVEAGILTEKVKVAVKNTSEWSDKVFAPTYALQPLTEVEQYINRNHHLPGIPSAKEMVERGNDLHQTDAKLLEKIEELTLYSIQLVKTNQQQQAEINELKRMVHKLAQKK